jgi:hypothetical protein
MADECKCKRRYDDGYTWWSCAIHGRVTADDYEADDIDDDDRTPRREPGGRKPKDESKDEGKGKDEDEDKDEDKGKGKGPAKPPVKKGKAKDGTGDNGGDDEDEDRGTRTRSGWWKDE